MLPKMINVMAMTTLMVVCLGFIVMNGNNFVSGQEPYNSQSQTCCNGTVQDIVTGQPACCGTNAYDALSEQCCDDGSTVIPLLEGNNTLTCCAAKPVVAGYNQKCCGGKLSDQPTVASQYDTFDCCNEQIYIVQRQSCCNGVVSPDANQVLQCCNDQTSYDRTKQICCESKVLDVPGDVTTYAYGCCGDQGYDTTVQICDYNTNTIYAKPANASCASTYSQVCGGKVLNPNEQCCNDEAFRAPTVWIDDGTGTGNGNLGSIAYCCPNGQGLIEDPSKETCCSDPKVGVLPIDLPSQQCCANQIIDSNVNICCDDNIQPGSASASMSCCARTSYNYNTQLCCGDKVYEKSDGYDSCCTVNLYG